MTIEDPAKQARARRLAEAVVAIAKNIEVLDDVVEPRPAPGESSRVAIEHKGLPMKCFIVTEWRTADLTHHVRVIYGEQKREVLNVVYATGACSDEEAEYTAFVPGNWEAIIAP